MMHPLQMLSSTIEWTGKNLAYNLGFIPDDKLNWKPAPDAKTALEIAAEAAYVASSFSAMLRKQGPGERPIFSTREEAQKAVETETAAYAQLLLSFGDNDLTGDMQLPFGPMPKMRAITLPVCDALHHHGQIAYIQTLLGDTESHFYEMGT